MSSIFFFLAGFGAIAGAVGVVALRDPFFAVLALVAHLLSLAVLFLLLRAEFVAAAQVVVYAGAVMVLYVFVVAYVGGRRAIAARRAAHARAVPAPARSLRLGAAVLGGALLVELLIALLGSGLKAIEGYGAGYAPGPRRSAPPPTSASCCYPLPARVRDSVLPAADRGRRRRRARPAPRRSRRTIGDAPRAHPARPVRPRGTGTMAEGRRGRSGHVSIAWYLAVSAIVFALGAVGVIVRRNPLVVLLCLELMLNGANLSLIAFSRMWGNGDGQILALIVMTVAACEVCIGLGMIVAIYRRRLPIDVDEMRELQDG